MSFANIFSQSVACLLVPLILSFTEQKFLILVNPAYPLFLSCIMFGVVSKKASPYSRSSTFPLIIL